MIIFECSSLPIKFKTDLKLRMNKLSGREDCSAYYIQVLLLINTFTSACVDYNVQTYIFYNPLSHNKVSN